MNLDLVNKFLLFHTFVFCIFQQCWNDSIHNKLFQIKPTLGEWRPAFRKSRMEQFIISRLRIGHTRLTHSFILKQEQPPQCLICLTPYTIKHILMECDVLATTRERHFKADDMRDLFKNINMDDVLSFLREAELYLKI